jgi:serine/arginine repetitive matrix protein 1
MDEFGRPTDQVAEEQDQLEPHSNAFQTTPNPHDEVSLPVHNRPPPSSPAPFSHYPATEEKIVSLVPNGNPPVDHRKPDDDDNGAGCCKCVIM